MSNGLKIFLYALFTVAAVIFGILFKVNYSKTEVELPDVAIEETVATPDISPNTNEAATSSSSETNVNATNVLPPVAVATNTSPPTNGADLPTAGSLTESASTAATEEAQTAGTTIPERPMGRIMVYLGFFVLSVVGLGFLIANDVSHYLGSRALKTLYNDDGEGLKDPEYDQAEQLWANGKHLEAIQMMRDYLKKNPREQHVALRIAEIYEKDLRNPLAAALEYEEVLKKKLPPDRWGWAAIHLCNLYFKLEQSSKAVALLQRIVNEYGTTAAAEKARKRLEQMSAAGEIILEVVEEAPANQPNPPEDPPGSRLPPGFSAKK